MSKIRKLYFFDKKRAEEMISFLNNNAMDNYINYIMFNPFVILHHLLPLRFKFLPESYVLREDKDIKALITLAPLKGGQKKIEIQKLFFEENAYQYASDLVQFAVSKYKAKGANSIIVKVDDYLPELLTMFVTKCGFSKLSYEKLWRVTKFSDSSFDKREYRRFRNSDSSVVTNLYNDSLLPHFRPLLSCKAVEFKDSLFWGLSYFSDYKYVIEDKKTKNVIGYISIKTSDNENFVIEIICSSWAEVDYDSIISYATYQIKKRKKRFNLYIRTKRYLSKGEEIENDFSKKGYECIQNQIVITNSSAKILKNEVKSGRYTILGDFCSSNAMPV